jgi:hypothetical protein
VNDGNDVDRWVNLDGPEPAGIRELMDAGREVDELTPEQAARLERAFFKALDAQERKEARERKARWSMRALGTALVIAGAAAAAIQGCRWKMPQGPPIARVPASIEPGEWMSVTTVAPTAPSAPSTSDPAPRELAADTADAGARAPVGSATVPRRRPRYRDARPPGK